MCVQVPGDTIQPSGQSHGRHRDRGRGKGTMAPDEEAIVSEPLGSP